MCCYDSCLLAQCIHLGVVIFILGLDGFDGTVGRVYEADAVAEELGSVAEHEPEGDERDYACGEQKVVFKVRKELRWRHFPDWAISKRIINKLKLSQLERVFVAVREI